MSTFLRSKSAFGGGLIAAAMISAPLAGCSHEVESPEVKLDHLEPDLICGDQFPAEGLIVEVHGDGFTPMPYDTLDEAKLELPEISLSRTLTLDGNDGTGVKILFPGELGKNNADHLGWTSKQLMSLRFDDTNKPAPGLYSVTVTNPDGSHSATLPVGLGVVPPPTITGPDPLAYCNAAEDGTLTLEGENFIQVGDATPTVTLSGPGTFTLTASELAGCTPLDGLSEPVQICTEATFPVPGGTLPGGEYDVVLTNPDPVGCSSTDSIKLTVLQEGPILFYSDPPVVYSGINTQITLYLTAITSPATVTIQPADGSGTETELTSMAVAGKDNRLQATVPSGSGAGDYEVTVTDGLGCTTSLNPAVTVTDALGLTLSQITPSFGQESASTPVTILRGTEGVEFAATPRGFLNPANAGAGDVAIGLESLTFVDGDRLTAVVPEGTPAGTYDLVVVNPGPGNEVGLLEDAFVSITDAPPKVGDIVPQSIVDQTGQSITIIGTDFRDPTVSLSCVDGTGAPVAAPDAGTGTLDCNGSDCTLTATIDGSALSSGYVCVVRVLNADGSYADFSAIGVTNSSFNLSEPRAGTSMTVARRALGSAAVKATSASRFVYAIGGDSGDVGAPLDSVEFAPIDVFGNMADFIVNREPLVQARTYLGTATVGRYVYVFGGSDGTDALASGERALVLSPEEIPHIEDLDLCLSGRSEGCWGNADPGPGLDPGGYAYRVSALIDADDPQNLGGETLASDPIIVKLPNLDNKKILVQLTWSPPLDDQGDALTGITGYRIYRIPVDGVPGKDEVLLAEVDGADTLTFVDDGTQPLGTEVPLPLGSTSAWQALPDLGAARMSPAGAAAVDPSDPTTWYVYALLGKSNGAESGGTALDSYEYLTVSVLPNGRQTVGTSWTDGMQNASIGRWQHGAWTVDRVTSNEVVAAGDTWIYLGGGALANNTDDGTVEAALVQAGGDLGTFDQTPGDFSNVPIGYGTAAAAGRLFCFGGASPGPKSNAIAAGLETPAPTLDANAWNNEGLQMTTARYLPGSSIQSAFIFLLGGETDNTGTVTATTETVVW